MVLVVNGFRWIVVSVRIVTRDYDFLHLMCACVCVCASQRRVWSRCARREPVEVLCCRSVGGLVFSVSCRAYVPSTRKTTLVAGGTH